MPGSSGAVLGTAAIAGRFRDIATAPKDGTLIEVRHGPDQVTVLARWAGQSQAWIRDGDPLRRTLHMVNVWRPAVGQGAQAADAVVVQPPATARTPMPAIVYARKPRRSPFACTRRAHNVEIDNSVGSYRW